MHDTDYPLRLLGIARPPAGLYFRGDSSIINTGISIAVIGSRHVSYNGSRLAYQTGHALAKGGIHVVNGLALGCDTHALKGALSGGGKCIAVMPCGLDQVVPKTNSRLAKLLLNQGGCLLSEYPVGTQVQKYQYVERDRLQSGISDGVIVIEAEETSGTMHTVRYAMRQGRSLACIDSDLLECASGNRWLSRQSGVKVIRTKADLEYFLDKICKQQKISFRQMTLCEYMI